MLQSPFDVQVLRRDLLSNNFTVSTRARASSYNMPHGNNGKEGHPILITLIIINLQQMLILMM